MSWSHSLIKLASYEVEVLQKRLSEIVDRRLAREAAIARLAAEADVEKARATRDPDTAFGLGRYLEGVRRRQEAIRAEVSAILMEEAGARDALAEAFEAQKKYEQVAETARALEARAAGRRETAALDELGMRKAATR